MRPTPWLWYWTCAAVLFLTPACSSKPGAHPAGGDSSAAAPGAIVASPDGPYELELPTRWTGHYRVDSLSTAERGRARPGALVFEYLPSDSTVRPQALLVVAVYDSVAWREVRGEAGPPPGDSVAARNGLVYVVALPQSNPFAPGSTDATVFGVLQLHPAEVVTLVRLR